MSDRLTGAKAWNRARALKLHEHFKAVERMLQQGGKLMPELKRMARLIDGLPIQCGDDLKLIKASAGTLKREWYYWLNGGREGSENEDHVRKPEALLMTYKAGCGGHRKMPRLLIKELQRRMTHTTGGRDKDGKSPITAALETIKRDWAARRPLPGVDYDEFAVGCEFPWHYSTACRNKAPRTLRALGNRGASAAKAISAYVSLNYSHLRKGELYTLDDVRLDITCIDEATGKAIEVVLYVFMEVSSRLIVDYVMKPAAAIHQEDVDELLAHGLQTPGFGIGQGYVTHILFERGSVACSDAAQQLLEQVTDGGIKIHRTGMVGGVRWIGAGRDKARGNAAGKAVIESFNRSLNYALLHLPGQRGNDFRNQPENLGDLNKGSFFARPDKAAAGGGKRMMSGTLVDRTEQLAQFEIVGQRRLGLKLPMLYLMELNAAVREAIQRHNTEPGHDYRGHGKHFQAEAAPGVWADSYLSRPSFPADLSAGGVSHAASEGLPTCANAAELPATASAEPGKRKYVLKSGPAPLTAAQRNGTYWSLWNAIEKARPDLDRFALTRRAIGSVPKITEMTAEQFAQVIAVFTAIARETTQPAS